MHSSAFGTAARIIFRSLSRAARLSSLNSSMFLGFTTMDCVPDIRAWQRSRPFCLGTVPCPFWTSPSCDPHRPVVFRYAYFRLVAAQLFESDLNFAPFPAFPAKDPVKWAQPGSHRCRRSGEGTRKIFRPYFPHKVRINRGEAANKKSGFYFSTYCGLLH
jgi:hypothetical protein